MLRKTDERVPDHITASSMLHIKATDQVHLTASCLGALDHIFSAFNGKLVNCSAFTA